MTNKDRIDNQKKNISGGVTEELLDKVQSKEYYSGDSIKVGDIVLFGFLQTGDAEVTLIKFKEEEHGIIYEDLDYFNENEAIPFLKLKTQI
jgi:hypothetical protein